MTPGLRYFSQLPASPITCKANKRVTAEKKAAAPGDEVHYTLLGGLPSSDSVEQTSEVEGVLLDPPECGSDCSRNSAPWQS